MDKMSDAIMKVVAGMEGLSVKQDNTIELIQEQKGVAKEHDSRLRVLEGKPGKRATAFLKQFAITLLAILTAVIIFIINYGWLKEALNIK
jgi:hypothetical protein